MWFCGKVALRVLARLLTVILNGTMLLIRVVAVCFIESEYGIIKALYIGRADYVGKLSRRRHADGAAAAEGLGGAPRRRRRSDRRRRRRRGI